MSRQRRSLRDRDEFAIGETPAGETPAGEQAQRAETAPDPAPDAGSHRAPRNAGRAAQATPAGGSGPTRAGETQRFGIYFRSAEAFDDAKSAYLSDWEQLPESPDTFAGWVAAALHTHARRTPKQRAAIATAAEKQPLGNRTTRTFILPAAARTAAIKALADDGRAGRWGSLSQFGGDAIAAAVNTARETAGGTLPPAPPRLPNRLHR